ncbi:peroxisomal assembly protein, partial [Coemansia spiralis]
MPSFWTTDAPCRQLQVRIRPGEPSTDHERCLAVPSDTYEALRASLAQRQAHGDVAYASVVAGRDGRCGCVVRVARDEAAAHGRRSTDGAPPVCVAGGGTWAAVFGRDPEDDDVHDPLPAALEPIAPVALSEIVLGVASEHYAAAQMAQAEICRQISSSPQVFSRGLVTALGNGLGADRSTPIALECLMCQPVSQGIMAADGSTRVVIVKVPPQHPAVPGEAHDAPGACDAEQWDLGAEWFILGDVPLGAGRDRLADAAFNGLQHRPKDTATMPDDEKSRVKLAVVELTAPPNSSRIVPAPYPGEDLENRGYLPLALLAKMGIVSGSWVLVTPSPADGTTMDGAGNSALPYTPYRRAIRVFGWDSSALSPDAMALPPVLFHNVCAGRQAAATDVLVTPLGHPPPQSLPTHGGRFSDRGYPQPLDTARKVVLARVSSPLAERRDLEQLALAALREWLLPPSERPDAERPLRVVQTGDLIAVRVALADGSVRASVARALKADASRRALAGDHSSSQASAEIDSARDVVLDGSADPSTVSAIPRANELVFYQVACAEGFRGRREPQQVPSSPGGSSTSDFETDSSGDDSDSDHSDGGSRANDPPGQGWVAWHRSTRNAGLVVRPDVTMVSQTGATHGFVPYCSVAAYMAAAGGQRGRCDGSLGSATGTAVPYSAVRDRLVQLARASLHPLAVSRGLTCAVLLKGNPGTGKRHLVRDIAGELGAHLYELSCYDILSETEDKTAQVLQMYFQNARRYAPCVFHLRAIDALSQASSTPPGQEPPDSLPIARVLGACIASAGQARHERGFPVIVVATSSHPDGVHASLAAAFRHELELP